MTSPTAQPLFGASYGGGMFVLVGAGGTILTSPDGNTWTPRPSGTSVMVRGATYSPDLQLFAAVGDQGTILTSSDAIAWTPRSSSSSVSLNNVAWGGGIFVAVGDGGAVISSPDGVAWTTRQSGVTSRLLGIAHGLGQFVVTGEAGTILATTDGGQFRQRGIATAGDVAAVVFSGTAFSAVGDNGLIAACTDPRHWTITDQNTFPSADLRAVTFATGNVVAGGTLGTGPQGYLRDTNTTVNFEIYALTASPTVAIAAGAQGAIYRRQPTEPDFYATMSASGGTGFGQSLTLRAHAYGVPPYTYQWYRDDQPIPGANADTLSFPSLQPSDRGSYHVRVQRGTSVFSTFPLFALAVPLVPPDGGAVDPSFATDVPGTPGVIGRLVDGRIMIGGSMFFYPGDVPQFGLARLTADGAIDDTFRIDPSPFSSGSSIQSIRMAENGDVVIQSYTPNFQLEQHVVHQDGSWEPYTAPVPAPGVFVPLAGGGSVKLVVSPANVVTVTRRAPDESVIEAFDVALDTTPPQLGLSTFLGVAGTVFDPQGRIIVAAAAHVSGGTGYYGEEVSRLFRLLADGRLDATFPLAALRDGITRIWCHPQTGKLYYFASSVWGPLLSNRAIKFARLNPDGSPDATYGTVGFDDYLGVAQTTVHTFGHTTDGSFLLTTNSLRTGDTINIVRYDTDGRIDPSYRVALRSHEFGRQVPYASVQQIMPLADGRLLLQTNATNLNGLARTFLVRVFPSAHDAGCRLANLSIRTAAGAGDATVIAGFVVAGLGEKTMLVRGVGPGLANFSVANPLTDPRLTLFAGPNASLTNDNWSNGPDAGEVVSRGAMLGAFPLGTGSKDAAAIATLAAGLFTMHIGSNDASTGIVLAEAYDADAAPADFTAARVVNLSARAPAGSGPATLIAGFSVTGSSAKRVLIRAIGPGLIPFTIAGALADPGLTLFAGPDAIATNNDWGNDAALAAAFDAVDAFNLPADSKDAALLVTLAPGTYTAQVTGAGSTTGVALIEVYEVP